MVILLSTYLHTSSICLVESHRAILTSEKNSPPKSPACKLNTGNSELRTQSLMGQHLCLGCPETLFLWSSVIPSTFREQWKLCFLICPLLLLLLLSHFSCVRLCVIPQTAAHQAPPSLGFSRQGHWSGLPFPSPMHESEKWKWSHSVVSDS